MNGIPRFRVGILGAGHICPFHLRAIARVPDAHVEAIYDLDSQRAAAVARAAGIPHVCTSCDELLGRVNVVHVLTPPASHAQLTLQALTAGRDVFVEKPLATSLVDCDRIVAAVQSTGRTVGVDHSLLRDPFMQRALREVQRGAIGRVLSVECLRNQDGPVYEGGPLPPAACEGGSPFRDLGIHALYQIEAFLGPIEELQWSFERVGRDPVVYYDEWRATARCQKGSAHLHISWNARPLQDVLIVQGTKGALRLDRFGMTVTRRHQTRLPEHPQRVANVVRESAQQLSQALVNLVQVASGRIRRYHGVQEMVLDFYDSLREGREPAVSAAAARRTVAWVERVAGDADQRRQRELAAQNTQQTAKTLVTGGTGFIGGHLVQRLLSEGRPLRLLCRRAPGPEGPLADRESLEIVIGDLGDPDAVDRAVAGIDVVYHVGGTVHGSSDSEFWRGSLRGTENIVASSLKHGVKQLIYVSSLSVLAMQVNGQATLDEAAALEPQAQQRGIYTQTKLAAEEVVSRSVREQGLPAVILRPGEVVGPGAPLLSPGIGVRRGRHLMILGHGQRVVPMIHVEDLIDAMCQCERRQIIDGSVFHLVDRARITQDELARTYCELTGQQLRIWHIPESAVYALGMAIEGAYGCIGRTAPVNRYRLRSALAPRHFDVSRAEQQLGWRPRRGVAQALRDTLAAAYANSLGAEAPRSSG